MYRVYMNDQTASYPLFEPLDDTLRIYNPKLTQEVGSAGCFKFHMLATHPHADKINLLKTEVIVYDDNDNDIFSGRILSPEYSMENIISITCEGDLTYLIDSQQRPYEHTGSIPEFMRAVLDVHNSQVDDYKKIYLGTVTVTDADSNRTRSSTDFSTTIATLKSQLVEVYGGYLKIRRENGKRYLDYVWDYGGVNNQVIRFGENMLKLNKYMDAANLITCLIPMGADVEYADSLGEKKVKTVDITSVNNGLDYIQNDAAIKVYGKVWGTQKWNDVTDPEKLLAKAKAYLAEASALPISIEVSALDLSILGENVEEFHLGYWTQVSSEPHGIEGKFLLRKRVINLLDPTAGEIELGKDVRPTLTGNVAKNRAEVSKAVQNVAKNASSEMNRKVENATALITGGLGGYVVLDNIDPNTGEQIHPWRILIMNTPDKDTARNVIQFNQNGIGFSTTGINGPYTNAWTIDGNLVADFITSGTMSAERIRGGTLEIGGSDLAADGKISVLDARDNQIGYWDKTGLHILKGTIRGSELIGNTIETDSFYADDNEVRMGDFVVSADATYIFRAEDDSIIFQTKVGGPMGSYAALSVGDTQLTGNGLECSTIITDVINGTAVLLNDVSGIRHKFAGRSIFEVLELLSDRIDSIDTGDN